MGNVTFQHTFNKDEVIFKEGDPGECFYDIVSGIVGIYVDYDNESRRELTRIEAGHIFGELALVDGLPRSATAVALDNVVANEVRADEFRSYFDEKPERVTFLIKEIGERITRLTALTSEAREALKEASDEAVQEKQGVFNKIKRYASEYSMKKKFSKPSQESKKAASMKEGEDTFSKTVDLYNKGDVIFREGEPARCMYNVQTGWVDLYTGYGTPDEKLISTVGVATFFGEIGLISDSVRSLTAVAGIDRCMVESLKLEDFEELYTKSKIKVIRSIEYLSDRVRQLTDQYMEVCKQAYELCEKNDLS